MATAFIIMQIGNEDLDRVCAEALVPAIESCGLEAKRVDKHNEGGLLKSEIINFIHTSDIIVADLTNERPNCYLEIGYAMGIDKFRNLIMTVREDHLPQSPNYTKDGPKVHFDLGGYDILIWHVDAIDGFRQELEKRIRRRLAIINPPEEVQRSPWDEDWLKQQRITGHEGLAAGEFPGAMEIRFVVEKPKPEFSPQQLKEAARTSTVETFGWPIGVYLDNQAEYRPRPRADGIFARVSIEDDRSFDYWAIKRTGDFCSLSSLFEDRRVANSIFFDTRIIRATEGLLYCARLYARLGMDPGTVVHFALRFTGLRGRVLTAANPGRRLHGPERRCEEYEVESIVSASLQDVEANLVQLVMDLIGPMLVLFDFFELGEGVYEDLVTKFVRGEV